MEETLIPQLYALVEDGRVVDAGYPEDPTGWLPVQNVPCEVPEGHKVGGATFTIEGETVLRSFDVIEDVPPMSLADRIAELEALLG
jgi:hypothetical protein